MVTYPLMTFPISTWPFRSWPPRELDVQTCQGPIDLESSRGWKNLVPTRCHKHNMSPETSHVFESKKSSAPDFKHVSSTFEAKKEGISQFESMIFGRPYHAFQSAYTNKYATQSVDFHRFPLVAFQSRSQLTWMVPTWQSRKPASSTSPTVNLAHSPWSRIGGKWRYGLLTKAPIFFSAMAAKGRIPLRQPSDPMNHAAMWMVLGTSKSVWSLGLGRVHRVPRNPMLNHICSRWKRIEQCGKIYRIKTIQHILVGCISLSYPTMSPVCLFHFPMLVGSATAGPS